MEVVVVGGGHQKFMPGLDGFFPILRAIKKEISRKTVKAHSFMFEHVAEYSSAIALTYLALLVAGDLPIEFIIAI